MSKTTEIAENDLAGLPDVISRTLLAHPTWAAMDRKIVCAGPDCDWVKPAGKGTKKRFHNHQVFELQWAIGEWYDREDEATA
jgi:hypothetical protein